MIGTDYGLNPIMNQVGSGSVSGSVKAAQESKPIVNPGESTAVEPGKKSSPAQCETCKNRKYQDGSDEMVSFKGATHISPATSTSKVMAHEQEHVKNAYEKAAKGNGRVLQASVQIKMAVCPECGRTYCAGGLTSTKISYPKDKYSQNKKSAESMGIIGSHVDAAV